MLLSRFVAAIKTGRYTHAKKAKDITEVKRLLAQKQRQHKTSPSCASQSSEDCMDHDHNMSPADTVDVSLSPKLSPVMNAVSSSSSPSSSSPLASNDLEQIIDHITNVYLTQTPLTPDFIAALPDREKHFLVCSFTTSRLCSVLHIYVH